jgi:two-component system chemotaxis sensor kinase CheA
MERDKYLEAYLSEMREHLETLNRGVLELEKNPSIDIVDELFRSFHTIKGMSATMGYSDLSELSHLLESLLDEVRSNRRLVDEALIDVLLESLDLIETEVSNLESGSYNGIDTSAIIKKIERVSSANLAPDEAADVLPYLDSAGELLKLDITLERECMLKSVRAFMVFKELGKHGEVVKCIPEAERIEAGDFGSNFTVYLATKKKEEEILKDLKKISEIEQISVKIINVKSQGQVEKKKKEITSVQSIRVPIQRLDYLMNLVGELVISKSRLASIGAKHGIEELREAVAGVDRLVSELQDEVMEMRMVEVAFIFDRFPRMVRDLAKKEGKLIDFVIEGREIKLDRTVLDELGVPLVHLLRNAVDHGIELPEERKAKGKKERGVIKLVAKREKKHVEISVIDDGRGIDPEKIKKIAYEKGIKSKDELRKLSDKEALMLIFAPGISSADKVTDVSGRGVGMDVVRSKILSLGGAVEVESEKDRGTRVTLRLPITLAIIQALLVGLNGDIFVIPMSNVMETLRIKKEELKTVLGRETIQLRGQVIPFYRLSSLFNRESVEREEYHAVIVEHNGRPCGIIVDRLLGQQEIVIKPLDSPLRDSSGLGGATILGDGRVALILDIPTLIGGD